MFRGHHIRLASILVFQISVTLIPGAHEPHRGSCAPANLILKHSTAKLYPGLPFEMFVRGGLGTRLAKHAAVRCSLFLLQIVTFLSHFVTT